MSLSNSLVYQQYVPLKDKNWFGVGGNALWYVEPTTAQEFEQAIAFARDKALPIFVLGEGANILISDEGFDGLVIHPKLQNISHISADTTHALVTASAGLSFGAVINYCLDHNLLGLEEFSGIPGTVGGSVYINIHYFEFLLNQFLVTAEVIEKSTGKILSVDNNWFDFGYDQSKLFDTTYYLVTATFKVKKVTPMEAAYARGRHHEIIRYRQWRYPKTGTCGSFFRNFHAAELEKSTSDKKLIYVAYYFDKLGIKGDLHVNDAWVSHQHANMLVNKGNATATDIVTLARKMQELVSREFGLIPQAECQLIGFKEYPLL